MKLTILLAGVSLLASEALAGNVSNVTGTLDTTLIDPAPALYPHFVCASGCSSGGTGGPVTQSGNWNVGISNFPATQTVNGAVSVSGVATSANQPALHADGGALSHITNLPAVQAISGSVAVSNLPTTQAVTGTVSIGNFPATQAISGSSGTYFMQGAVAASANSMNVYEGGGVGVGPPSSSAQTIVRYFEQTNPAGVPIDPTIPAVAASANVSSSISAANVFQVLLTSSISRKGCSFQNTSVDTEYIDVADTTASATKARSYQIQPGSYWFCSQSSGLVISDLLSVTAPNSGDTFIMTSQ